MSNTAIVFVVVLALAVGTFGYFLARRVQYLLLGVPERRLDHPAVRTVGFVLLVFGQRKLFKKPVGIIHFCIFWGFIIIAFGTLQVIAEGVREGTVLPWGGNPVFNLIKDILSALVLIGLIAAAYIRYVVRPKRLDASEFEVVHHTQFLFDLIRNARLNLGQAGSTGQGARAARRVTYHDSCYLGRYNGIFDSPRHLLAATGYDLVELPRNRAKGFCCGAGGGRMWLEEDEGERIDLIRTDEVLGSGASIAAVACPYCLTMLKDGVDHREAADQVRVMDVAEILEATLPM